MEHLWNLIYYFYPAMVFDKKRKNSTNALILSYKKRLTPWTTLYQLFKISIDVFHAKVFGSYLHKPLTYFWDIVPPCINTWNECRKWDHGQRSRILFFHDELNIKKILNVIVYLIHLPMLFKLISRITKHFLLLQLMLTTK